MNFMLIISPIDPFYFFKSFSWWVVGMKDGIETVRYQ